MMSAWEAFEAVGWTGGVLYAVREAQIAYSGWRYRRGGHSIAVMGFGRPGAAAARA